MLDSFMTYPVHSPTAHGPGAREFQAGSLQVLVCQNALVLAETAMQSAATHLLKTLSSQASASVILATGQSQLQLLDLLFRRVDLDWKRVRFFHMDEYLGLPEEHAASFRYYLRERVESRVKCLAFHYLNGNALEPINECERYAKLIQSQPVDLCFLGIGDNGHLAFNDPPVANFEDPHPVKIVKLDDVSRQQQVNQGHFPGLDVVPRYALTLTLPTLCSARRILCLAPGRHKASVVKATLEASISPDCPATILRRLPQATLLLEPDSARLLAAPS
jgi:glucosamine-6-phosphate deaminase